MDSAIVTGLFTMSGMVIGAGATIVAALISRNAGRKDRAISRLSSQVKAYWALEEEYVQELGEYQGKSKSALKSEYRERVRQKGYDAPCMTAKDVEKLIDSI